MSRMTAPIDDMLRRYAQSGTLRLHMPGHKGLLDPADITEIDGADVLDTADGIIGESEKNAAALFGAGITLYSAGGSSQCIKAMLAAVLQGASGARRVIAARNAHRAFLHAAALLDIDPEWLYPPTGTHLCACPVSPAALDAALSRGERTAAVYVTSPDYLGHVQDIRTVAAVCRAHGVPLLVDGAHGAYLPFLPGGSDPLADGAAMWCCSGHKTLPVLTGGAYLHVSARYRDICSRTAPTPALLRAMMSVFGSSSPPYPILRSLDLANVALSDDLPAQLAACAARVGALRAQLAALGWHTAGDEPLKLTVDCAVSGYTGTAAADHLRAHRIEPEYADRRFLVLMFAPATPEEGYPAVLRAFAALPVRPPLPDDGADLPPAERRMSVRAAMFAPQQIVPTEDAAGRICGAPIVGCPPAVPIAVSGETIGEEAVRACRYHGIRTLSVVQEQ